MSTTKKELCKTCAADLACKRVVAILMILERYHQDGDNFLDHVLVVVGDEREFHTLSLRAKVNPCSDNILIRHQNL
jgi:hypothetical protein